MKTKAFLCFLLFSFAQMNACAPDISNETKNEAKLLFDKLFRIDSITKAGISLNNYRNEIYDLQTISDSFSRKQDSDKILVKNNLNIATGAYVDLASVWDCGIQNSFEIKNRYSNEMYDKLFDLSKCDYKDIFNKYDLPIPKDIFDYSSAIKSFWQIASIQTKYSDAVFNNKKIDINNIVWV